MVLLRNKAFTLIEVLIALLIFAIIGVIAAIGLRHIMLVRQHLQKDDKRLSHLMMAVTYMRRDFSFMLPSSNIRTNDAGDVSFIRSGVVTVNPNRSDLLSISYHVEHGKLIRASNAYPAILTQATLKEQTLLNHVQDWRVYFVDQHGHLLRNWLQNSQTPPLGVIVKFNVEKMGQMQVVIFK